MLGSSKVISPSSISNPLHATCVAVEGKGLLIVGPSSSGKSSIALEMMACGAMLVSDDRCELVVRDGKLFASAPQPISGQIEARGIGILNAEIRSQAQVVALLDMEEIETERLPESRTRIIRGVEIPCYHKPSHAPLAAAMIQLLKAGRYA